MMKFFAAVFLLLAVNIFPQENTDSLLLERIRTKFYEAVENEEKLYELEELLRENFGNNPEKYSAAVLSYHGGAEALKAKHAFNPISKLSYLIDALDILEKSVKMDSSSLEIRFMRFSILHHVPGILGYGSEREEDKDSIVRLLKKKNYGYLSFDIQRGIINFMLDSERLSPRQQQDLEKLLSGMARNE